MHPTAAIFSRLNISTARPFCTRSPQAAPSNATVISKEELRKLISEADPRAHEINRLRAEACRIQQQASLLRQACHELEEGDGEETKVSPPTDDAILLEMEQ